MVLLFGTGRTKAWPPVKTLWMDALVGLCGDVLVPELLCAYFLQGYCRTWKLPLSLKHLSCQWRKIQGETSLVKRMNSRVAGYLTMDMDLTSWERKVLLTHNLPCLAHLALSVVLDIWHFFGRLWPNRYVQKKQQRASTWRFKQRRSKRSNGRTNLS